MSKDIVVQIAINKSERSANQGYSISSKSWKKWCDANNVELFSISDEVVSDLGYQWNKLFILNILDIEEIDYNRVLYVDSDTIVHPKMPYIFDLVGDKFGVVRNFGCMDWVCRSIENCSDVLFNKSVSVSPFRYFNSGVMVFNKSHKKFFELVKDFYSENKGKLEDFQSLGVGKDQPILNYFTEIHNIEKEYLPYEYNMQDMNRFEVLTPDMLHTTFGWIYHFNGGVKPTPGHWMQETFNFLNSKYD